ncbi:MAG: hypothetical protein LIO77_09480 [Rikenellaceae bacterium]|nr:hypothetical protein [Rikenellaceae bacterium]
MKNNPSFVGNPFVRIAGMKAFCIGIIFVTATVLIGYMSHTVFIGELQVKFVRSVSLMQAFAVQFSALAVIAAVMYGFGTGLSRNVRFIDILGTVTLSRWPLVLSAIPGFFVTLEDPDLIREKVLSGNYDVVSLMAASIVIMAFAVYATVLLFRAYKISTGLKGIQLRWSFFAALAISELLSALIAYKMIL